MYDSTSSYSDKELCQTTLGSALDYDDLLKYTIVSGGTTKKWGYFVRTWQSVSNIYHTNANWVIANLKCKFIPSTIMGYMFFDKNSI